MDEEQVAALALSMASEVPLRIKAELVSRRGSCRAALAGLPTAVRPDILRRAEAEWRDCERKGFTVISLASPRYPSLLKEIVDPPPALYVWGGFRPADAISLAVVGCRRASPYGIDVCERLSGALARRGATIVSGLARGIDGIAHQAALSQGGRTVAVLGSGLDRIYPREHRRLAERVAERAAVISEFPLTSPPLPAHFPRRNRIISGLALGVIVVEAAERSGSLISARNAVDQNREVFAVPGPIDSPTSRGVNRLIQEGAKLVSEPADVIEELRPDIRKKLSSETEEHAATSLRQAPLGGDDELVLEAVLKARTADVDKIVDEIRLSPERIMAALVSLEIKGKIRSFPGGIYSAKRV